MNNCSISRHFYRLKTGIGLAYLPDNSNMKKREITSEFTSNVETSPDGHIQLVESSNDSFLLPFNNPTFRHFYRLKTGIGLAYLPDNSNMKQMISQSGHVEECTVSKISTQEQAHKCAKCQKTLDIAVDSRLLGPHLCTFCSIPNGTIVWSMGNDGERNFRDRRFGGSKK